LAIGINAGRTTQGFACLAIGINAGQYIQGANAIAIGTNAGSTNQGSSSVAVGYGAGQISQGIYSNAIGYEAGLSNQGPYSTAIGFRTAYVSQGQQAFAMGFQSARDYQKEGAFAMGYQAALLYQGTGAIAMGYQAGYGTQGANAIAIGYLAGTTGQKTGAIAIGWQAGLATQGTNAIAIGNLAGQTNQHANSIIINATGTVLTSSNANALVISPINSISGLSENPLTYNLTTKEIRYNTAKTFVIDHPINKNKYLVHACLEGPESGVYYRGKGEIVNNENVIIHLPDYVEALATDFTVQITPIYSGKKIEQLYTTEVENNSFTVNGQNCKFFWFVQGKRNNIDVEPFKRSVDVKGNGPYKWI